MSKVEYGITLIFYAFKSSETISVLVQRSNEVKITERAVKLELNLQHRPDAILKLGGLLFFKSVRITFQ